MTPRAKRHPLTLVIALLLLGVSMSIVTATLAFLTADEQVDTSLKPLTKTSWRPEQRP